MTYHARLSPSGAHRWMRCPGSIIATEHLPRTSSVHADEGTAAHEVGAWCLTEGTDALAYVGRVIPILDGAVDSVTVTADMAGHVQTYVDAVREQVRMFDGELRVETDVPIGAYTGEPGATGSADALVLLRSQRELQVHDLKFGAGVGVSAFENRQLMLYALGALTEVDPLGELFDTVRLFIHQPRRDNLSEWLCPMADLLAYAQEVRAAAAAVKLDAPRVPGAEQCKFCQVKATCAERRQEVSRTVFDTFDVLDFTTPAEPVPPQQVADLAGTWERLALVEAWCKDVRAYVFAELQAGRPVGDLKLTRGREGNRAWSNPASPDLLTALTPLGDAMYQPRTLLSPTQAEKALKKAKAPFDLSAFVIRPPGSLTVARGDDPSPAVSNAATPEAFDNVTAE